MRRPECHQCPYSDVLSDPFNTGDHWYSEWWCRWEEAFDATRNCVHDEPDPLACRAIGFEEAIYEYR